MAKIIPNANFYSLGGRSVHEDQSEEYKEYRRQWMENPEQFIVRDFPVHLDLEITSLCNLRCTFCDKLPLLTRDRLGSMDFALYKRIIDEGSEHDLWGVKLSYRGEPLLHRDIVEMVDYAKRRGVLDIYFNTNGMLLNSTVSEELIDAGLNRISISMEGIDSAAFEKERVGAKFDVIVKNIETLLELREKRGVTHPKVRIQTVLFPGMDLQPYNEFWQPLCDEVAAVDYKDESNRKEGIVDDWACPQLWQRMTVEWDGSIFPCNNDDLRLLTPGSAGDRSIYECWHDQNVQHVRDLHRAGRSHEVKACNGCPWRTAQISKLQSEEDQQSG